MGPEQGGGDSWRHEVMAVSSVLAAVVAFGAMILFHELGHFLAARRAGVGVRAFGIGFGPAILKWRRGETDYSLNLVPLGGYVNMEGEDAHSQESERSFGSKGVAARMGIIAAGPAMNLVLAVLILAIAAGTGGVPLGVSTRVGTMEAGWPAAAAGILPGDEIAAIDGIPMESGDQVISTIHRSPGRSLVLTVRRGSDELSFTVTPRLDEARGVGRIGFSPEPVWKRLNPAAAVAWGGQRAAQLVVLLLGAMGSLVREGKFFDSLGGPVAAGSILAQAARSGAQNFLHMAAFLSIIIGVFNLLPIPALDGGRLAFLALEGIRRRRIDPRSEGLIHTVGFMLLLLLLATLTVRDVRRL